jgi:hypothetical protein
LNTRGPPNLKADCDFTPDSALHRWLAILTKNHFLLQTQASLDDLAFACHRLYLSTVVIAMIVVIMAIGLVVERIFCRRTEIIDVVEVRADKNNKHNNF